ncbi:MAG: cupin domain-containing protein [Chloroflexi bacterium]|nr:cupin domain-containing protein [Chloroflexota bacterium]MCY3697783.1 cupin domain-containing protein [Chloroflexota bacterium]
MAERVGADEYRVLLRHGTMSVGLYTPKEIDKQSPHDQDEVYIVASGTGVFALGSERMAIGPGDTFFVGAGARHRFEEFSDDLAVWVVFYGPKGGEHSSGVG